MKKYIIFLFGVVLVLFIFNITRIKNHSSETYVPDKTQTNSVPLEHSDSSPSVRLQTFPEIGISLEVPDNLEVVKTPNYNPETSDNLESYTFYIQDYKNENAIDFQIYGLYQNNIPTTSWEQLEQLKNEKEVYQYAKEINLDGLKGLETQLAGERNNFVYLILLRDRVLRIAVSPATEMNKERADSIINTLKVL